MQNFFGRYPLTSFRQSLLLRPKSAQHPATLAARASEEDFTYPICETEEKASAGSDEQTRSSVSVLPS